MTAPIDDRLLADQSLPRVLIADRNLPRVNVISDLLRTHRAASGIMVADTDDQIGTQAADVALCGPGPSAPTRLHTLRNLLAAAPNIPTIFLCPPDDPQSAADALDSGATDAIVCAPGYLDQLPLRVLAAWRTARRERAVAQRVLQLADTVAQIERDNAELRTLVSKFQSLASTDPLTGLSNRRALASRLEETLSLARRMNTDVSVMLIDLDGFKFVNDTLGHEIGDQLLRAVAVVLRQVLRRSDIAGRLGGDEFVVVMPHTPASPAEMVARRIQQQFARFAAPLQSSLDAAREGRGVVTIGPALASRRGEPSTEIGMTIGVTSRAIMPDATAEELLAAADSAMYRGKRQQRGSVVVALDAPAPSLAA